VRIPANAGAVQWYLAFIRNGGVFMQVLRQDPTPNPDAIKFVLDRQILPSGSRSWRIGDVPELPLAGTLLAIEGVISLFFVANVITISKDGFTDWAAIASQVTQAIEFAAEPEIIPLARPNPTMPSASAPDLDESAYQVDPDFFSKPESAQVEYLNDVLDQYVRPGLASDGGGLLLREIMGRIAYITYQGACGSCPSAASGTLNFIEHVIHSHVHPEMVVELV
jgi:NFU1 iron-sulfur cluster scaffold homolog, mitochondrial